MRKYSGNLRLKERLPPHESESKLRITKLSLPSCRSSLERKPPEVPISMLRNPVGYQTPSAKKLKSTNKVRPRTKSWALEGGFTRKNIDLDKAEAYLKSRNSRFSKQLQQIFFRNIFS